MRINKAPLIIVVCGLLVTGCKPQIETSGTPLVVASPTGSPNSPAPSAAVPITLPGLDALFAGEAFKADLKSKMELTEDQVSALRKNSSEAVTKILQSNAENQSGRAEPRRPRTIEEIPRGMGPKKVC